MDKLAYFSPKYMAIVPVSEEYFSPFSRVEPFGYDNARNDGIVKFWRNLGKFPYLPENRR